MPEAIADTSPLQYLFQLDLLDLLPALYQQVLIPEAVVREIAAGRSRGVALPTLESLAWIRIRMVGSAAVLPMVTDLGAGEREVLALAVELAHPLVILDDALARRFARRLEIPLTGTLGLLLKAKQIARIERVVPYLDRLEDLNFRLDMTTRASVLKLAGESG
jgi:predicted nucleic acid-binding protein